MCTYVHIVCGSQIAFYHFPGSEFLSDPRALKSAMPGSLALGTPLLSQALGLKLRFHSRPVLCGRWDTMHLNSASHAYMAIAFFPDPFLKNFNTTKT